MNKNEFLNELRRELAFLSPEELSDAIDYYDEYISDSGDEETALWELGSPKRVAEDMRREYYGKNEPSSQTPAKITENVRGEKRQKPVWLIVLIVVLAVGFGVPVVKFLGHAVSSVTAALVLVLIALLVIKLVRKPDDKSEVRSSGVETCSDIQNLDIRLGAGRFVIEQGSGFRIEGGELKSRIENGTWHISRDITEKLAEAGQIVTITVPSSFTAGKATVLLGAGELLIRGLSAYETDFNVSAGNMEVRGLYAKQLNVKCGVGRIAAEASLHGSANISCGMGDASIKLTNRAEEFNYSASVGLGRVVVGGREMNGNGQTEQYTNAPYDINIKCGMGNVRIDFGGVN